LPLLKFQPSHIEKDKFRYEIIFKFPYKLFVTLIIPNIPSSQQAMQTTLDHLLSPSTINQTNLTSFGGNFSKLENY